MNRILFSTLILFFIGFYGHSQTPTPENPIDKNFSELIEASNSFEGYKVVDYDKLTSLQERTSSYIAGLKEDIAASQTTIEKQQEKIAALEEELANIQVQLEEITAEKDAIAFLGIPFSKSSYKMLMWGIVALLIFALVLFIIRFKKSHIDTREARKNLQETEKEFEVFRTKSLEKEQRLGRLLQDERNKLMKISQ